MLIAVRKLRLVAPVGDVDVPVRLFAPVRSVDDWSCRYEIGWPHATAARAAYGVDAMQALTLAMQMISSELYASEAHQQGRLGWERAGEGYGFPPPATIRGELVGRDKTFF
jgi:hypothetical protein